MSRGRQPGGVVAREIGHVLDVNGARLVIGVDCDAVTLTGAGITLDAAARDLFARYYFDAEAEAEKWQQEHDAAADRCPRCGSPDPAKHPAVQFEGEVQVCPDPWHSPVGQT